MRITLIPLVASFHMRFPAYNTETVVDCLKALKPDVVVTTAFTQADFESGAWLHTPEVALPLSVVPWVQKNKVKVLGGLEPSPDPTAEGDFRRYIEQYTQLRQNFAEIDMLLRPVQQLLQEPLNLERISSELMPLMHDYQNARVERFEDGPANDWIASRCVTMAQNILDLRHDSIALLASIDHIALLEKALRELSPTVELNYSTTPEASDEARLRSKLDFAFRSADVPEAGNVIAELQDIDTPEASYHYANLLLTRGHIDDAWQMMENISQGEFFEPYFLPAYVLARLGQLRDLVGKREQAKKAYQAVLALDFADAMAIEVAQTGLKEAFNSKNKH